MSKMRSNLVTTTTTRSVIELDGLSGGYLDGEIITGRLLTIIAMRKVVSKWTADGKSLETQILLPSDPFPDFKALNKACPQSEWFEKFGKLMGPYQGQRAL